MNYKQIINFNKDSPFTLKYQPYFLSDIIDYDYIVDIFKKLITTKSFPHILLYGPPGSGKTSIIQTIINELFKDSLNYTIINASEKRGVEIIRTTIYSIIKSDSINGNNLRLIILDEMDNLTQDAQIILKSIINENDNVKFIFICNYETKIDIAIKSNCLYLRMDKMSTNSLIKRCNEICTNELIFISNKGLKTLIKSCRQDIRKILNILQSLKITFNGELILKDLVKKYLNIPNKKEINNLIINLSSKNNSIDFKINLVNQFNNYNLIDIIYVIAKIRSDKLLELAKLEKYIYTEISYDILVIYLVNIFN